LVYSFGADTAVFCWNSVSGKGYTEGRTKNLDPEERPDTRQCREAPDIE